MMKKLKKLAALLLVGVMALALLTACGGGSSSEAQAEKEMLGAINGQRGKAAVLTNDPELQKEAKEFLNVAVDAKTGKLNAGSSVNFKRGDDGIYTFKVVVKSEYNGTVFKDFLEKVNGTGSSVDVSTVGKWTKVGVVASTVKGNMYVSVVFQVNLKA